MNAKISLPDITAALAKATEYDIDTCEAFIKDLFATISQTLISGESVKVKGIGTFKAIDVESRKSVNVNTGYEMIIPGHRKVSFTPDKTMAEAVNAPFAMFEPVELADSVSEEMLNNGINEADIPTTDPDSSAIITTVESVEDMAFNETELPAPIQTPTTPPEEEVPSEVSERLPETVENDNSPAITEHAETEQGKNSISTPEPQPAQESVIAHSHPEGDEDKITKVKIVGPIITQSECVTHQYNEPVSHNSDQTLFHKGLITGAICSLCIVAIFIASWRLFFADSFASALSALTPNYYTELKVSDKPVTTAKQSNLPAKDSKHAATQITKTDTTKTETQIKTIAESSEKNDVQLPEVVSDRDKQSVKSTATPPIPKYDKITKTRFLTTMAREYYGDYNYWPLIYDANKGLGHPDRIRPGTKIKIPSIQELGNIDLKDPSNLRKAKNRGIQIYSNYRRR